MERNHVYFMAVQFVCQQEPIVIQSEAELLRTSRLLLTIRCVFSKGEKRGKE